MGDYQAGDYQPDVVHSLGYGFTLIIFPQGLFPLMRMTHSGVQCDIIRLRTTGKAWAVYQVDKKTGSSIHINSVETKAEAISVSCENLLPGCLEESWWDEVAVMAALLDFDKAC